MYDATVFIGSPPHPIFRRTIDEKCGTCPHPNDSCSFDNSDQTVHAVWKQGHLPCGYEADGFVAVQRVEIASPELGTCNAAPNPDCPTFPLDATTVTLVREIPCCGHVQPVPGTAGCP